MNQNDDDIKARLSAVAWETPTREKAAFSETMEQASDREQPVHRRYPWPRVEPWGVLPGLEGLIEQIEPDLWDSLRERVDPATGLPRCSSDEDVEADERVIRQAVTLSLLCMAAHVGKGLDLCPASFGAEAVRAYEFINPENDDEDLGEADSVIAFAPPVTPERPA